MEGRMSKVEMAGSESDIVSVIVPFGYHRNYVKQ